MDLPKIIVRLLMLMGFALCLLQVWLPGHYVTGDGPCHLYNAQIVHDLWSGQHTAFYNRFYLLEYKPDPNWLSTFVLALLLFVANGAVAEKLFLSIYVLVYVSGFYLLLKKLSGLSRYWLPVIFIFIFPLTLAKGFYNFSFSIAFYFWMVWSWLELMEQRKAVNIALFFLATGFIFFTHLLPFVFGAFSCGALAVSYAVTHDVSEQNSKGRLLSGYMGLLLLLLAPFLILMGWFTQKEGGLHLHLAAHPYRLIELAQFKYIITLVNKERLPAMIAGCSLLVLCVPAAWKSARGFRIHKYDGLMASLLFAGFVYLFFPEDFMGRAIIIGMRVQLFVFILVVCCLAYRMPEGSMKYAGGFVLFACFSWLSVLRMECSKKVADAVDDQLFAGSLIRQGSVVWPLNFAREGKDAQWQTISDRNSVFHHAADYLGLMRPMILLDNYEANMGYFPVKWKGEVNPYNLLGSGNGIEGQPPGGSISGYKERTGVTIDYILMWCYDPPVPESKEFNALYDEIKSAYHVSYTSPSKRTILWERN